MCCMHRALWPASHVGYISCTSDPCIVPITAGLELTDKMNCSSLVLLCVLLIGSVWMIQGKSVAVDDGPQDQDEVETTEKLPGLCWTCKWVMNKVKKEAGKNPTEKTLTSKLLSVCDKIGFLKSRCQKFVKAKLQVLVEELSTTDDVRTICVNVKACKPKEAMTDDYYPKDAGETFSGRYMEEYR